LRNQGDGSEQDTRNRIANGVERYRCRVRGRVHSLVRPGYLTVPNASALAGLSLSRASPDTSSSTSLSMPGFRGATPGVERGRAIRGRDGRSRICGMTRGRRGSISASTRNTEVIRQHRESFSVIAPQSARGDLH